MSNTKNTGGPAFPRPMGHARLHNGENTAQDGMTLRDHFAGLAMQGELAGGAAITDPEGYARWCYGIADAMLKAREQ